MPAPRQRLVLDPDTGVPDAAVEGGAPAFFRIDLIAKTGAPYPRPPLIDLAVGHGDELFISVSTGYGSSDCDLVVADRRTGTLDESDPAWAPSRSGNRRQIARRRDETASGWSRRRGDSSWRERDGTDDG